MGPAEIVASLKELCEEKGPRIHTDEIVEWNERSIADAIRRQARHEDTTRWDTIDFKLD